jgi:DNA-binding HxlR family transcriptional regulator
VIIVDKEIVNKYLRKVPIEIRIPIKKLKNDQIWAIYIALINEKPKFFGQLEEQFKANPSEISRALKTLVDGGLIDRQTETFGDMGNPKKIFYAPTPVGIKFYDMLFDVIVPVELVQREQKQRDISINLYSGVNRRFTIQKFSKQSLGYHNMGLNNISGAKRPMNLELEGGHVT